MYSSKIAVLDVCAWPQLIATTDGGILAFGHNTPSHGFAEGGIDCWFSSNGGDSWEFRAHAVVENPGESRVHLAVGRSAEGELLVISTGFDKRPPRGQHANFDGVELCGPDVMRSRDEGLTWERSGAFKDEARERRRVPFGKIISLEPGVLGVSAYGEGPEMPRSARLYVSEDDGMTWFERSEILPEIGTEADILNLGEGRLLAAVRNHPVDDLKLCFSKDHGHTWEYREPVTLPGQHPAHLLQLADGSILLTFGIRNAGYYGVGARRSSDGGLTWEPPLFLHEFGMGPIVRHDPNDVSLYFTDAGYPSSLELAPGKLLTAFYAREGNPSHRYYLGTFQWQLQEATSGSPVA